MAQPAAEFGMGPIRKDERRSEEMFCFEIFFFGARVVWILLSFFFSFAKDCVFPSHVFVHVWLVSL